LWVAFFVHDLGYWGKPNMDGEEGEWHVLFGARVMTRLFDLARDRWLWIPGPDGLLHQFGTWGIFSLLHSRFLCKRLNMHPSRLCCADKLAVALEPAWLYLPRARASGEIHEYMKLAVQREGDGEPIRKYATMNLATYDQRAWLLGVKAYLRAWAWEHRDGRADTWTPNTAGRTAATPEGVWK